MMRVAPRNAFWRSSALFPLASSTLLHGCYVILLILNILSSGAMTVMARRDSSRRDTSWARRDTSATSHHQDTVPCNVAQQNCVARIGCGMAFHNYLVSCGQVMHGQKDECPSRCRKALVSLLSTEDRQGEAFMECSCNNNSYCHTQKRRLEVCSRDVLEAMKRLNDDSIQISCSLAELICRADSSCLAALSFFDLNCGKLQTGEKCTARCNNSLGILLRQKKGRTLKNCVCDGTETYQCHTVQDNIDRLCHHRRHHHNHTRSPRPQPNHPTTPSPGASEHFNNSVDTGSQPQTSSAVTSFRSPLFTSFSSVRCDTRTLALFTLLLLVHCFVLRIR